jgi:hypothetical protein
MSEARCDRVYFNHRHAAVEALHGTVATLRGARLAGFQHCVGANESQRDFLKCDLQGFLTRESEEASRIIFDWVPRAIEGKSAILPELFPQTKRSRRS